MACTAFLLEPRWEQSGAAHILLPQPAGRQQGGCTVRQEGGSVMPSPAQASHSRVPARSSPNYLAAGQKAYAANAANAMANTPSPARLTRVWLREK